MDKQLTSYRKTLRKRWRTLPDCSEFPRECTDIWIRPPRHEWPKSWSNMEDPVLTVILWQDYFMGKAIWESSCEIRLGKSSKLGMFIRSPSKRIILICVCGWHKIGWKETKHWSDVESTQQRSGFGRTNIFPRSCVHGLHSKTMPNKQRCCGQYRTMFESRISRRDQRNYHSLKIFVFLHGLMTWLVMQRSVWNDIVS